MPRNTLTISGLRAERAYQKEWRARPEVKERLKAKNEAYRAKNIERIRERDRLHKREVRAAAKAQAEQEFQESETA